MINLLSETKILHESQVLGRHKAPGSGALSPTLFEDDEMFLAKSLRSQFVSVLHRDQVLYSQQGSSKDCANLRSIDSIEAVSVRHSTF